MKIEQALITAYMIKKMKDDMVSRYKAREDDDSMQMLLIIRDRILMQAYKDNFEQYYEIGYEYDSNTYVSYDDWLKACLKKEDILKSLFDECNLNYDQYSTNIPGVFSKFNIFFRKVFFENIEDIFYFGKHKSKTLIEVVKTEPLYLSWCFINIPGFHITNKCMNEIKKINPDFLLSDYAMQNFESTDDYLNELAYEGQNNYNENYERDTFNALTDGQNGDYDDWKESGGDMDHLMDEKGF